LISEVVKKNPSESVIKWLEGQDEQTLFLSALTLGELPKGISKLPATKKRKALASWLENDLRQRFKRRILGITEEVALIWGRIQGETEKREERAPVIDSLIAATAIHHRLTIVTRNGTDMERCGAIVLNVWRRA
jgi:predicted nucleic acid-binding protein